jgi:Domain of unknown function (DUF5666)
MGRWARMGVLVVLGVGSIGTICCLAARAAAGQAAAVAKAVGTVKSISGQKILLAAEGSGDINVVVMDGARLLRIEPGQTDLKNAAPLELQDLQPGDRILVRGQAADNGKSILALSVIAMKKTDIAEKQKKEQEQWTRHGTGGLVTAVDPAAKTITIDTSALAVGANKNVTIKVADNTVLRRYAPGSVKFDEATPAPFDQIKVGDQLRARGTRSPDGTSLAADEIVSGSFRNIAGTITTVDAAANTVIVNDLATKKPVTVKINSTSQVKKLPEQIAQRIAARLRGNSGEAGAGAAGQRPASQPGSSSTASAPSGAQPGERTAEGRGTPGGGQFAGRGANAGQGGGQGSPDLQQAISRMPAATLAELQKGDAVMIVATAAQQDTSVTAITLLAGVEPILQASGGQSILTPWNMGGAPTGEGATQ